MMNKVERKKSAIANVIIKEIKLSIKVDKKIAKWENEKLYEFRDKFQNREIRSKIDQKIEKNKKCLNINVNKKMDKELKKIIKKVSPTLYEEIPNDVLDVYGLAINYYHNNNLKGLILLNNDLKTLEWEWEYCDLDEVLKVLKFESKDANIKEYLKIKELQSKQFLASLSNDTFNID